MDSTASKRRFLGQNVPRLRSTRTIALAKGSLSKKMPKPTAAEVETRLRDALQAAEVVVIDTSSGCGSSFDVAVVSSMFEGKGLLQRHRLVSEARQGQC